MGRREVHVHNIRYEGFDHAQHVFERVSVLGCPPVFTAHGEGDGGPCSIPFDIFVRSPPLPPSRSHPVPLAERQRLSRQRHVSRAQLRHEAAQVAEAGGCRQGRG